MTTTSNVEPGNFVSEQVDLPEDTKELLVVLKETLESHALMINRKDTAQYENEEVQVNQTFPGADIQSKRQVFRKVIDLGTVTTGANAIPHNIDPGTPSTFVFTRMFGSIFNQATPLWVAIPNDTILVTVDATNVNVTIPGAYNDFSGSIVLEFYKA